jgi:poly(A) polymerase
MKFKDVAQMRQSTLKRFVRLPQFEEHLALHELDCKASHGLLDAYNAVREFLAATPPEQVRPARLLTGDDLNEMGYAPGPVFQKILGALEDAQLEGRLTTKDQAKDFVRQYYPLARSGR